MSSILSQKDQVFMRIALEQADKAYENLEIPVGAIIVSGNGTVLSKAYNKTESQFSQACHAEILAINKAGKKKKDWRLNDCTMYVTLEPCLMCMGLICISRIARLVCAVKSPLFGFCIDNQTLPNLYKKHIKNITYGVLEEEASTLLKGFFKNKRKKGE